MKHDQSRGLAWFLPVLLLGVVLTAFLGCENHKKGSESPPATEISAPEEETDSQIDVVKGEGPFTIQLGELFKKGEYAAIAKLFRDEQKREPRIEIDYNVAESYDFRARVRQAIAANADVAVFEKLADEAITKCKTNPNLAAFVGNNCVVDPDESSEGKLMMFLKIADAGKDPTTLLGQKTFMAIAIVNEFCAKFRLAALRADETAADRTIEEFVQRIREPDVPAELGPQATNEIVQFLNASNAPDLAKKLQDAVSGQSPQNAEQAFKEFAAKLKSAEKEKNRELVDQLTDEFVKNARNSVQTMQELPRLAQSVAILSPDSAAKLARLAIKFQGAPGSTLNEVEPRLRATLARYLVIAAAQKDDEAAREAVDEIIAILEQNPEEIGFRSDFSNFMSYSSPLQEKRLRDFVFETSDKLGGKFLSNADKRGRDVKDFFSLTLDAIRRNDPEALEKQADAYAALLEGGHMNLELAASFYEQIGLSHARDAQNEFGPAIETLRKSSTKNAEKLANFLDEQRESCGKTAERYGL
ncbi:MAG: hypothetical protein IJL92_04055 [Thermoguttaceae bacterium]|nr:hypothetical protein [Thermoguttaceae bacterium]